MLKGNTFTFTYPLPRGEAKVKQIVYLPESPEVDKNIRICKIFVLTIDCSL